MAKKLTDRVEAWRGRASIRYTMFLSFTASAIIAVFLTGITLYLRFSSQLNTAIQAENQMVMEQVEQSLSTYLRDMLGLADSCSYNVVKGRNVQNEDLTGELMLLYDTYSEYVDSIAVFDPQGNLVATAPAGLLSKDATPQEEPWFSCAVEKPENLHFSQPQVQHVFSNGGSYRWVVPLSSAVELTRGKSTQTGVLLIQLRYSALTELFSHVSLGSNGYGYLTDSDGCLLYHPFLQRMDGKQETAYRVLAEKGDGAYEEVIEGRRCAVLVRTAGYTGWRILGVVSQTGITFDSAREILLVLVIFSAFFLLLTVANFFLSRQLTDPIRQLEVSVRQVEGDGEALIYVGGALETRQLGESVQKMVWQMQCLAQEAAAEHEAKRKTELNALQAQINPHFLYNTLDIIVWMVENEQPTEAVRLVTALARFFRISLSGGRNVIPVRDELEHVRNYLVIQEMRYKNKFHYQIHAEDETLGLSTIKLMIQPIVENAICHGMEFMDETGLITIDAAIQDGDLVIAVKDNGLGMTEEQVARLLDPNAPPEAAPRAKKGSGVGLQNVQSRIRLYFGPGYGLTIESEPDLGTKVTFRLPAIPYGEMEDL